MPKQDWRRSWDSVVRGVASSLPTGKKWTQALTVLDTKSARHMDSVGHVRQGRGGFGLGEMKPMWQKATPIERMVEVVHHQEEAARCTRAISQAKLDGVGCGREEENHMA